MKERIKQIRKHFKLTQKGFGDRIGIGVSAVSLLESGQNNPSEQTILLICQAFNVSYTWLTTGEGEMLQPDESEVDALAARFGFAELCAKALHVFDTLDPDQQDAVLLYARKYAASLLRDDPQLVAAQLSRPSNEEASRKALANRLQDESSASDAKKA